MSGTRRKAANGEGSVFRRTRRGKTEWVAQVSVGRKTNGKRRYITRTAPTEAAARRLLRQMLAELDQGRLAPSHPHTVASYALYWSREIKPHEVRKTTAAGYEDLLRRYVIPALGSKRLNDLHPQDIQALMSTMRAQRLSVRTINQVRSILSGMCRHAWRSGLIASNPVSATDALRRQAGDKTQVRTPWTLDEVHAALRAFQSVDELDCFVHLMLGLGLRPGEALGLQWSDIDEEDGRITIARTLKEGRSQMPDGTGVVRLVVNDPKTRSSRRVLSMTADIEAALTRQKMRHDMWRLVQGRNWSDSGFVITSRTGLPVYVSNLRRKFYGKCDEYNLRRIRLHDLRHAVARLALEGDVPLEQVSQALGHTRLDTTKQIYAGSIQKLNDRFVESLGQILHPSTKSEQNNHERVTWSN